MKNVNEKKEKTISFRVTEDFYSNLKKLADADQRPIGSYARKVLADSLTMRAE